MFSSATSVVVALVVVVRFVHVLAEVTPQMQFSKGPVLLGHQPHFSVATNLFAVVVEDFDQGVEVHVASVWVSKLWNST